MALAITDSICLSDFFAEHESALPEKGGNYFPGTHEPIGW
jgi:hypothetical protein